MCFRWEADPRTTHSTYMNSFPKTSSDCDLSVSWTEHLYSRRAVGRRWRSKEQLGGSQETTSKSSGHHEVQCEPQVNHLTPSSGRTRTGEVLMLRLTQGVQKWRLHVNNPAKVALTSAPSQSNSETNGLLTGCSLQNSKNNLGHVHWAPWSRGY